MWLIPFLVCAALVVASTWHLRGTFLSLKRASAPGDLPARDELSLYDAAHLHGGAAHAAVTAFLAMRLEGRLILSRSGTATVTDPTPRNSVEAAIVDTAGPARRMAVRDLAREVRTSEAVRAIGLRLVREGFVPQPVGMDQLRKLAKSRAFHGWMLVAALVVGVVTVPLATATGNGGLLSLLAFLLLLALGSVPAMRYRAPDTHRSNKGARDRLASVQDHADAAWQPADVGLATQTTASLKAFALGSTGHVPGMADDEVQTLLNEFRAAASTSSRRSAATAATATAAAAAASAGYASGVTPSGQGGCGSSGGHDGGHSCGGCGGGGGCGGCGCGG
ncbi:TIGR04222 domain-containing membrane protein [Streptomyces klenkii]|uniref:TIGR04222 domain-containing membrane protein n=1 Tax=Streptomyces klenkii TaxID=1420899 RepID=UPI0033E4A6AF